MVRRDLLLTRRAAATLRDTGDLEVRHAIRARIAVPVCAHEVLHGVGAAGDLHADRTRRAVRKGVCLGGRPRVVDRQAVDGAGLEAGVRDRALHDRPRWDATDQVATKAAVVGRVRRRNLREATLGERRPARRAGAAPLRLHHDDAIGGCRSVEGGGRWSLDDVHALDRLRIERAQSVRRDPGRVPRLPATVEPNAVDDDERLIGERERRVATNANLGRRADDPLPLDDLHAGGAGLEHILNALDRRHLGERIRVHRRHHIAQRASRRVASRCGHDVLESRCRTTERRVGRGLTVCRYRHRHPRRLVADARYPQHDGARRHAAEHVVAVGVGDGADVQCPNHDDLRRRHGLAAFAIGDPSAHHGHETAFGRRDMNAGHRRRRGAGCDVRENEYGQHPQLPNGDSSTTHCCILVAGIVVTMRPDLCRVPSHGLLVFGAWRLLALDDDHRGRS